MYYCKKRENHHFHFFLFRISFYTSFSTGDIIKSKPTHILKDGLIPALSVQVETSRGFINEQAGEGGAPVMSVSLKLLLVRQKWPSWNRSAHTYPATCTCQCSVTGKRASPPQTFIHCLWCFKKTTSPGHSEENHTNATVLRQLSLFTLQIDCTQIIKYLEMCKVWFKKSTNTQVLQLISSIYV